MLNVVLLFFFKELMGMYLILMKDILFVVIFNNIKLKYDVFFMKMIC